MALGIVSSQATVAATETLICANRTYRKTITIINEGTTDVRIGGKGVTTGTGALLTGTKGAGITIETGAPIYGIVESGTQAVSVIETY